MKAISIYSGASVVVAIFCIFFAGELFAEPKLPLRLSENRNADNDEVGLSKTLEQNFSPEDRARLRKALSDYARNTDPDHQWMEQKRKAMHDSISQRFNECNRDNDDSLDREEATLCLPQVARHFSYVDVDDNGVITLEELELAQSKLMDRQKAFEAHVDSQSNQDADADAKSKLKVKSNAMTTKEVAATRKRPG